MSSTCIYGFFAAKHWPTASVAPKPCTQKYFKLCIDKTATAVSTSPIGQFLSSNLSIFWHPCAKFDIPIPVSPQQPRRTHLRFLPNSPINDTPVSVKPLLRKYTEKRVSLGQPCSSDWTPMSRGRSCTSREVWSKTIRKSVKLVRQRPTAASDAFVTSDRYITKNWSSWQPSAIAVNPLCVTVPRPSWPSTLIRFSLLLVLPTTSSPLSSSTLRTCNPIVSALLQVTKKQKHEARTEWWWYGI